MDNKDLLRFLSKIKRTDTGCWEWTASKFSSGYGYWCIYLPGAQRKAQVAHRAAYEHFVGSIPVGLDLDHLCRNRACVNPEHLEPVTRSENLLRSPLMGQQMRDKEVCVRGHPLVGENASLKSRKDGHRVCKICARERQKGYRQDPDKAARERELGAKRARERRRERSGNKPVIANQDKTHCPQGHEYAGDNVLLISGTRRCRICIQANNRKAYLKRREKNAEIR